MQLEFCHRRAALSRERALATAIIYIETAKARGIPGPCWFASSVWIAPDVCRTVVSGVRRNQLLPSASRGSFPGLASAFVENDPVASLLLGRVQRVVRPRHEFLGGD